MHEREVPEYSVEQLRDQEHATAYLCKALRQCEREDGLAAFFLALRRVAEARGIPCDALSVEGPYFEGVAAILHSMGLRLSATRAAS